MPYTEAQKRANQKYRQSEKGKAAIKKYNAKYKQTGKIGISYDLSTKSEFDVIAAIEQLPVPKGQYAKIALKEKLVRDGYLIQDNEL